ncbi:MAG: hypothetical protein M1326_04445 [Cyanobacteria bacterium]|nr:hypothetical protein [Cyanobacteriota bacterium]
MYYLGQPSLAFYNFGIPTYIGVMSKYSLLVSPYFSIQYHSSELTSAFTKMKNNIEANKIINKALAIPIPIKANKLGLINFFLS